MSPAEYQHVPVLLNEVAFHLITSKDGLYVDATYGRGGHCRTLLGLLSNKARIVGFDKDEQAIESAKLLASQDPRLIPVHAKFSNLRLELNKRGLPTVDGILILFNCIHLSNARISIFISPSGSSTTSN